MQAFYQQLTELHRTGLKFALAALVTSASFAAPNAISAENSKDWNAFQDMRRKYRQGSLSDSAMWRQLMTISSGLSKLPPVQQATILQAQATVLKSGGYPILSAINAAQAIRRAPNPLDDDFKRSWTILRQVSQEQAIQNLLEVVADNVRLNGKLPPAFGTEWRYIEGNSYAKAKNNDKAIAAFADVKVTDRYFFPAKYQQAMIYLDIGNTKDATAALKSIVYPTSQELSSLNKSEKQRITDDANMALGRIFYETKQFTSSMKHYRLVSRGGESFYDSLFEQSWALFMAGYPNHALGMLYSVRSPFFKEAFNPEATMLAAIIYYWMCRYDDSRNELADFIQYHASTIKSLEEFLSRKNISDDTSYTLFENTVTGVSSESLGMPRSLLNSAAEQQSMMYVRNQFAAVLTELQRLDNKGIFGDKDNITTPRGYLTQWAAALKTDIGRRFLTELQEMYRDYERLHEQAEFLYVELLMSQKDQLLGKELHGTSKIDRLAKTENISGWGQKTQTWASDDKSEYWQDELGFHVFRIQPLCKSH